MKRKARNNATGGMDMIFGVLKDIKEGEYRVICTPMEVA